MNGDEPIWSVSEVNGAVAEMIENSLMPFWLGGEVGTLNIYSSGHVYMTLKDSASQLRAVYFRGAGAVREAGIAIGDRIEAFGKLTVYRVRGEYQFSVQKLRSVGTGELERRFTELRKKLEAEGLFAEERKKPLPPFPERIALVTSPDGAAVRDFLKVFFRRRPGGHIRIYPAPVQGEKAGAALAEGVAFFNSFCWADVIVLTRGGGSMEDLWCFNDETLARAIAASSVPVVSAVGHEIDFTIADFVADMRAPTPSAAAEMLGSEFSELLDKLDTLGLRAGNRMRSALDSASERLRALAASYVFREPSRIAANYDQKLDEMSMRMDGVCRYRMDTSGHRLDGLEGRLRAMDPEAVLKRGYVMMLDRESRRPIARASEIFPGREVAARFSDGEAELVGR